MKTKPSLTLGGLIVNGYRACGKRRAIGIIQLAANARLLVIPGTAEHLRNSPDWFSRNEQSSAHEKLKSGAFPADLLD